MLSDLLAFIVSHQKDICEQSIRDSGKTCALLFYILVNTLPLMSAARVRVIHGRGDDVVREDQVDH